jgi:hypothetical protein
VQSGGAGFRPKAQTMKDDFNRAGAVLHLLLCYTRALIVQMAQTAVCNRHHSLDQQLCRWLLLRLDRLQVAQCQPSLIIEETHSCERYAFQRATLLEAFASPGPLRKTEPFRATLVSPDGAAQRKCIQVYRCSFAGQDYR